MDHPYAPNLDLLIANLHQVDQVMDQLNAAWCGVAVRLTAPITSLDGRVLLPAGLTGVVRKVRHDATAPFEILFDGVTRHRVVPLLEKLEIWIDR